MKRYLIIKHYLLNEKGVVQTNELEKRYLLDLKERMCEAIIDTQNHTFFDAEANEWKEIKDLANN